MGLVVRFQVTRSSLPTSTTRSESERHSPPRIVRPGAVGVLQAIATWGHTVVRILGDDHVGQEPFRGHRLLHRLGGRLGDLDPIVALRARVLPAPSLDHVNVRGDVLQLFRNVFPDPVEHRVRRTGRRSLGVVFLLLGLEVSVDRLPIRQVERDRAVHLLERQDGERLCDALSGLPRQEGVDDRVQRHTGAGDPVETLPVLDVLGARDVLLCRPCDGHGSESSFARRRAPIVTT